jgi:hypothetical protein
MAENEVAADGDGNAADNNAPVGAAVVAATRPDTDSYYVKVIPDNGSYKATHITRINLNEVANATDSVLATTTTAGYKKAVKVIKINDKYTISTDDLGDSGDINKTDVEQIAAAAVAADNNKYVGAKGFWSNDTTNVGTYDNINPFMTAGKSSKRKSKKFKKRANNRYNKRKTRNYLKNNQ